MMKKFIFVAAMLAMALAAYANPVLAQELPAGPPANAPPGVCEHAPGEFLVGYVSEEALQAAPAENVVETFPGILVQNLSYPELQNADPASRFAAEEAKRQELLARPGVAYVEYNCIASASAAPESGAQERKAPPQAPPACANCVGYVSDIARMVIGDGSDGREAYEAALEAARSSGDDDNVAFAAEPDPGGTESDGSGDSGEEPAEAEPDEKAADGPQDKAKGKAKGDTKTGSGGAGKSADGSEKDTDTESTDAGSTDAGSTDAGSTDAGSGDEPVSGKNAASSEPRGTGVLQILALGAGALLLVAGVFVARRTYRG